MKKFLLLIVLSFMVSLNAAAADKAVTKPAAKPSSVNKVDVMISTSMGDIKVELYPDKAPITVKNFLQYVDAKYYDGLIFHRVISGFMVQGGGFDKDMKPKATRPTIEIESNNGLSNVRGTIAMARTNDPNSASSQFFINHKDNLFLDFRAKTNAGYGYTVFGKVMEGMDVVDTIATVQTGNKFGMADVPTTPVTIKTIRVVK